MRPAGPPPMGKAVNGRQIYEKIIGNIEGMKSAASGLDGYLSDALTEQEAERKGSIMRVPFILRRFSKAELREHLEELNESIGSLAKPLQEPKIYKEVR